MVPLVNLTAKSIRKWLCRFNGEGIEGLIRKEGVSRPSVRITPEQRRRMVESALTPPQALGEPFTTWSLSKLREHLAQGGIEVSWSRLLILRVEPYGIIGAGVEVGPGGFRPSTR